MLISTAQLIQLYLLFSPHFLFHCGLSQDTEYISLDGYAIERVDGEIIRKGDSHQGWKGRVGWTAKLRLTCIQY